MDGDGGEDNEERRVRGNLKAEVDHFLPGDEQQSRHRADPNPARGGVVRCCPEPPARLPDETRRGREGRDHDQKAALDGELQKIVVRPLRTPIEIGDRVEPNDALVCIEAGTGRGKIARDRDRLSPDGEPAVRGGP